MIAPSRFFLVGALARMVAACSTQPTPTLRPGHRPTPVSRIALPARRDGAPPMPIDPDDVHDAVPRPDPILSVGNASPYTIDGVTYEILSITKGYRVQGTASWYGAKFHGHETSMARYNLYWPARTQDPADSCYARVTNLGNGKSIIVRVNDRGPFHSDRVIGFVLRCRSQARLYGGGDRRGGRCRCWRWWGR